MAGAVSVGFNNYRRITPKNALSANVWYYVDVVVPDGAVNADQVLVYINGVNQTLSVETGTVVALNTSNPRMVIGSQTYNLNYSFNGTVDDVRIYDRALSDEEIALLYEGRTNVLSNESTGAGDIWQVKAIPVDSFGMNGSSIDSNSVTILGDCDASRPCSSGFCFNNSCCAECLSDSDCGTRQVCIRAGNCNAFCSEEGLILYYDFSQDASQIPDLSQKNNFGTKMGTPTWTNGYYYFNGSGKTPSDSIVVNDLAPLEFNFTNDTAFTISAWVKPEPYSRVAGDNCAKHARMIFIYDPNSDGESFTSRNFLQLALTDTNAATPDRLLLVFGNSLAGHVSTSNVSVSNGVWSHVAAVRNVDADTVDLYINGALVNSSADKSTGAWVLTNDKPRVGGMYDACGPYWFKGSIDEMKVYNVPFSSIDVQALYNSGLSKFKGQE
jgi:hypothetical protein